MMEIKQAEFFAGTGLATANTLDGGNNPSNSANDDVSKPGYPSFQYVVLDPTIQYDFYGYMWAAYSADSFAWIRGSVRFSRNGTDLARLPLTFVYKQGTGVVFSFTGAKMFTSAFSWGTTQCQGDIGFNAQIFNGNPPGEPASGTLIYLHRRPLLVSADRMDLDIVSWSNLDSRNLHMAICAVPVAKFSAQLAAETRFPSPQ